MFLQGAFGPLTPIQPVGIDSPNPESGRPAPRRFQYPVGWNLPVGTPGTEGVKLTSFGNLRMIGDTYSVARSCVDKCRQEILALEPDIVPTAEAEHAMRDDEDLRSDWDARRAKIVEFFRHPDSDRAKYPNFTAWLKGLLEDVYVLDAVALHPRPPRRRGAGLFGSDLASLDLLDGSTIRPLLNLHGATPHGGSVAYQQYVWGVPRVDMTAVMTDADLAEMDDDPAAGLRGEYRSDQLLYLRYEARSWTPYGFSPIEKGLLPISIGMARQQYQWDYYQDGSVPGQFVIAGEGINTPQQIMQLQTALNAMAGDIGAKHRIIVLPPGSSAMPQKPAPLADQFDEWILSQVAMPFGLTPMDLGVTPRVSAVQSVGESRQLSQINTDKGSQGRLEPVVSWLKDTLFDWVIQQVFDQKDMEWSWGLTERGDNLDDRLSQHVQKITYGLESVDEGRIDLGLPPWGLPETSVPLAWLPTGPVPLQSIGSAQAPGAAAGAPGQVPGQPGRPALPSGTSGSEDELTTPAHEAAEDLPDTPTPIEGPGQQVEKAVRTEVEILARHLRKGRPLEAFQTKVLTPEALLVAGDVLPKGVSAAASAAVAVLRRQADRYRRESTLAHVVKSVAAGLGGLVRQFRAGELATLGFTDEGTGMLMEGFRRALAAGSEHAHDDHPNTPTLLLEGDAQVRAEQQRGWLMRLLVVLLGAKDGDTIARRLKLYADNLRPAYNAGYGKTVQAAHPAYEIVWVLGETEHCALCLGRDGESFTFESLPGYPGDGGFGGPICEGGQLCGCSLEYREDGKTVATFHNTQREQAKEYYAQQLARITAAREEAAQQRAEFVESLPDNTPVGGGASTQARARNRDELRIEMARLANARISAEGGYPGVSVEPTDIPAKILAQLLPPAERGGLKDLPQISLDEALDMYFASKGVGAPDLSKVGPHGYIHGWIFVGIPGVGADVFHPHHGHGTVVHAEGGVVSVRFDSGHQHHFEVRPHPSGDRHSAGHFEPRNPTPGTPARPGPRELAGMSDDDLAASIVSDDDEHVANVLSELERRERIAAVAHRDQVRAEIRDHPPTTDEERDSAYDRLLATGADSEDAFAEAYGASSDRQRRDAAIAMLRSDGHTGRGFDGLARDAFRQEAARQYFTAEDATRGHMVNHAGRAAGINPADLFSGPESRARRYASDELREWWQDNGRLTFEGFTAGLLGQAAAGPRGGYWL